MTPVTPRHRGSSFLHPHSAYSGRSSRRSSASMSGAEGRMHVRSQLSDPSILIPLTSQTSDSVHQSALDESLFLDASSIQDSDSSYQWGAPGGVVTPGDPRYPTDNQNLFPAINVESNAPTPNTLPDDDMLNLSLPPNGPESMLRVILGVIQGNYSRHPNPEGYVSELARFVLAHAGSAPHSPASPLARGDSYVCLICDSSQVFRTSGAFKRHVNEQHQPKSYFHCRICDRFTHPRRDKLRNHLWNAHSRRTNNQQISSCEVMEPVPLFCNICAVRGLEFHPGPFDSWNSWYEGIRSHCRLQAPQPPPPASSQFFPDNDGGGASGYGGATGYGSASHGASPGGGSSLPGNDWNMGTPWSGGPHYGSTSSRNTVPIDASGDRPNCSDIKPTPDATCNGLNKGADSRQLFRDPNISQHDRADKDTGVSKGHCSRCNHGYDSCPGCPQKHIPGYCHLCNGPATAVGADHNNQSCNPTQRKDPPLARLVHGLSKLSLEPQQTVSNSDVPSKQALSNNSKSVYRNDTVNSAQPWSSMTIKFIPAAVNEFNPIYCLVVSISRLSLESSYMSQLMRMDDYPMITVDALMTGQKMLKNIHENPPGSSEKLVKQISRCQTALTAIGSEMSTTPSQHTAAQKARRKRLSSLWARLRAVAFVLALQKEVITDEIQEEPRSDKNIQPTLLNTIRKNIFPLAELGSLFQLVHKHFYGDFWASSGLLEDTKKLALEDSSGVFTFLRAVVKSISDPQESFLKEYAANECSAFIEDIF